MVQRWVVPAAAVLLCGVGGAAGVRAALAAASSRGGSELELLQPFDASAQEIPESVTTDREGNLYISVGNTVRRRTPDGVIELFGTLPLPIFALGVKVGEDGCVYTVSSSLSEVPGAFVWRICEPEVVEQLAELDPSGGPNDLAFDHDGDLFVTDPVLGQVWKVDPAGTPSVWLEHPLLEGNPDDPALLFRPLGANGIAFDARGRCLYVANTDRGELVRIPVRSHGPGAPSVFVADPALRGADGVAFDRDGTLYVAVNASDSLVSVSPRGRLRVREQAGLLDSPSSLVFGATRTNRDELYLTSSAFSRILGLKPGTPRPALLSQRVQTQGLRLP